MKTAFLATTASALVWAAGPAATAATNTFAVPSIRGTSGATFDGWEFFTVGVGGAGNAGDLPTSSGSARLFQTAAGALVLGSGNIYNGTEKSHFEIRYTGAQPIGDVVLQVRTLGTELAYDSVRLFAWTSSLASSRVELERISFGPPPPNPGSGVGVTSMWTWNLAALNTSSFAIAYDAADINLSLDSATLDVRAVPEPGSVALGLLGLGALYAYRRSRR